MRYRITLGDAEARRKRRFIVWDDETGRVTGSHSGVGLMNEYLRGPFPLRIETMAGVLELQRPHTEPADFLALMHYVLDCPAVPVRLPRKLRSVESTPWALFEREADTLL